MRSQLGPHERAGKGREICGVGRVSCEVRAKQSWRLKNLKSFDEFLAERFPDSRRKAYYLMAIHEHLPKQLHPDLKGIGRTKARELVKAARAEGERFDCAPWMHRASVMRRAEFKTEMERFLTEKDSEPSELLYFRIYKSQLAVIEQALETAGLMLGTDKSARLLPGNHLRGFPCRCQSGRIAILELTMQIHRVPIQLRQKQPGLKPDAKRYATLRKSVLSETAGGVRCWWFDEEPTGLSHAAQGQLSDDVMRTLIHRQRHGE